MWLLLLILFGLSSCLFLMLTLGLLRAGKRADEGEEQILRIISPKSSDDITAADIVDRRLQHSSTTVSVSEASTSK